MSKWCRVLLGVVVVLLVVVVGLATQQLLTTDNNTSNESSSFQGPNGNATTIYHLDDNNMKIIDPQHKLGGMFGKLLFINLTKSSTIKKDQLKRVNNVHYKESDSNTVSNSYDSKTVEELNRVTELPATNLSQSFNGHHSIRNELSEDYGSQDYNPQEYSEQYNTWNEYKDNNNEYNKDIYNGYNNNYPQTNQEDFIINPLETLIHYLELPDDSSPYQEIGHQLPESQSIERPQGTAGNSFSISFNSFQNGLRDGPQAPEVAFAFFVLNNKTYDIEATAFLKENITAYLESLLKNSGLEKIEKHSEKEFQLFGKISEESEPNDKEILGAGRLTKPMSQPLRSNLLSLNQHTLTNTEENLNNVIKNLNILNPNTDDVILNESIDSEFSEFRELPSPEETRISPSSLIRAKQQPTKEDFSLKNPEQEQSSTTDTVEDTNMEFSGFEENFAGAYDNSEFDYDVINFSMKKNPNFLTDDPQSIAGTDKDEKIDEVSLNENEEDEDEFLVTDDETGIKLIQTGLALQKIAGLPELQETLKETAGLKALEEISNITGLEDPLQTSVKASNDLKEGESTVTKTSSSLADNSVTLQDKEVEPEQENAIRQNHIPWNKGVGTGTKNLDVSVPSSTEIINGHAMPTSTSDESLFPSPSSMEDEDEVYYSQGQMFYLTSQPPADLNTVKQYHTYAFPEPEFGAKLIGPQFPGLSLETSGAYAYDTRGRSVSSKPDSSLSTRSKANTISTDKTSTTSFYPPLEKINPAPTTYKPPTSDLFRFNNFFSKDFGSQFGREVNPHKSASDNSRPSGYVRHELPLSANLVHFWPKLAA